MPLSPKTRTSPFQALGPCPIASGLWPGRKKGKILLDTLGFQTEDEPGDRENAISALNAKRSENKKKLFEVTARQLKTVAGFQTFIANCLNCYPDTMETRSQQAAKVILAFDTPQLCGAGVVHSMPIK